MRFASVTFVLISTLFMSYPAEAARVQRLSLSDLKDGAETIVIGVVTEITTRNGANANVVWTDYLLSVQETLKGTLTGAETIVSFAGGETSTLSVGISGIPRLSLGVRYVLFLLPDNDYVSATIGWGQGIYTVEQVASGSGTTSLLVDFDGQPLELDSQREIFRGIPITVRNGQITDKYNQSSSSTTIIRGPKAPDPIVLDVQGEEVTQPAAVPEPSPPSVSQRTYATLNDLRLFVAGQLLESQSGER